MQGSSDAPLPRKLSWKQLAAWWLCTIPAGAIAGGLFYIVLVARLSAGPHRYYSYHSSPVEQFALGANYAGLWAAATLPLTLFELCLWARLSRRLPSIENHRISILLGSLLLALPSSYAALLNPVLAIRNREVELCVWLVVVASLWLPRAVIPALAPLGPSRTAQRNEPAS